MPRSRFSETVAARIVEELARGESLPTISKALRIPLRTIERWLSRGRQEIAEHPYASFAAAADRARAEAANAPLTRGDFEVELAKAVRKGSVQALKLYAQVHGLGKKREGDGDRGAGEDEDPFASLE